MTDNSSSPTSPFKKSKLLRKRLKLMMFGGSGAGKTTMALQFPRPAVFDLEGGADLYGDTLVGEAMQPTKSGIEEDCDATG